MPPDKLKSMKAALKHLEKATKKEGVAYILGDREYQPVQSIPSGSIMFDLALGVGGLPKGRIIEFFGAESTGKTLCAIKAAGECQKQGGSVVFVDMEHTFDPSFSRKLGLIPEEIVLSQPDHLQDAFNTIDTFIDYGADIIILDSVASLVPREELEGEVGKNTMALVARYMSQFLKRIVPKAAKSKTTVVFINQIRENVGQMFGNPITTGGGRALKFYSSVRVEISKVSGSAVKEKQGGEEIQVGHQIRAKVVKNKVAAPFRKAEFMIFYDGRKSDSVLELATIAITKNLIPRYDAKGNKSSNGRTFKWDTEPKFEAKSREDVTEQLRLFPKVQEELLEMLKNGVVDPTLAETVDEDETLSEDEFEAKLLKDTIKGLNDDEAEETSGWDEIN